MREIRIFLLIALVLFFVFGYKTYDQYAHISRTQKLLIERESSALSDFVSSFRKIYQDVFLREKITIDKRVVNLLPVKTLVDISKNLSRSTNGDVQIRTVSDRPRNPENKANSYEMKIIHYFQNHPEQKSYFKQEGDIYYYARPLRIKKSCLKCHGKKEEAIKSIREKYDTAYNYKLGDLRGLLNIRIKKEESFNMLYKNFNNTLIVSALLYGLLLWLIYILLRRIGKKEEAYRGELEKEVAKKTEEIKRQKNVFEILFEKSIDGIFILEGTKIVQCNEQMVRLLKCTDKKEILGRSPLYFSPKYQPDGEYSYIKGKQILYEVTEKGNYQFEWTCRLPNGILLPTQMTFMQITLDNRDVYYVSWRDISKERKAKKKLLEQKNMLDYQAHHDVLTGLPNRMFFNKKLQEIIEEQKEKRRKIALLFIDLDQFKQINDSLGHEIGDKVLQNIAYRLRSTVSSDNILVRLGGDEFVIIMKYFKENKEIEDLAKIILKVISQPIDIEEHTLYVSSSIGISLFPEDDSEGKNLLKYADAAMYKAKSEGRDNYQFYRHEMTEFALKQIVMKTNLKQALEQNQLVVYYQIQMNAVNEYISGVEALVRWNHPNMGLILPMTFIPLAEESGIIIEIDKWVMNTAMREFKSWYDNGLNPGILSLNLTFKWLREKNYLDYLQSCIDDIGFNPHWLELEITERDIMLKPNETIKKLQKIGQMGIRIAIDDFGTGYSSLSQLKKLPIDRLKIDKSFMQGVPGDKENETIIKTIISLAENLQKEIIAEGVDSIEKKKFLLEHNCNFMQGYLYGKAIKAEEIIKKLEEES